MSTLFETCVSDIGAKYRELGYSLGWRFLSVSKAVLDQDPSVALITLNPAGNVIPSNHPWESCEHGASYLAETWGNSLPGKSNLQLQVKAMFQKVADSAQHLPKNGPELLEASLIAHFVPFRSPRIADLPHKLESFQFGEQLWRKIFGVIKPKLVICIDRESYTRLGKLLPDIYGPIVESQQLPTGWGNYKVDIDRYGDRNTTTLLRLPHLSTFKLFTSSKCAESVNEVFRVACHGL